MKRSIVVTITWITIKKKKKKTKVELFLSNDRENVEEYFDWEMKVEQIFECHQERRVSLDTLSFQGPTMYWWTSLVKDLEINNNPQIR